MKIQSRRSLLGISLTKSAVELKSYLKQLDKAILKKVTEKAKECYQAILEEVDEVMAQHKGDGVTIEHVREVWYQTCLGPVRVKRRQYRDREGRYRYLLDELMGMSRHQHVTSGVQELALELVTAMPYRRSAEVLRKTTAIDLTHQTIWRLVARAADPNLEQAEREVKWFMQTGELPEGEGRQVTRLMVEADGVMLSLQREKERKAEVKLGIAYEGWEKAGKDRYRTVNKTVFSTIASEQAFWAGMNLKLSKKYDLSGIGETIVGGDGARWVKEGADYMGGRFQLDRYHLHRELTKAFNKDRKSKSEVWAACQSGKIETALQIMADAAREARGESAQRITKAYHYLRANSCGLVDYRLALGEGGKELRRTGAIEGNVDKMVARRMKNQGMSWTLKGVRRLLCIRFLVFEGKLTNWLAEENLTQSPLTIPVKKVRRLVNRLSSYQPDDWLKAGLPALIGPHASRPWAQALKSMAMVHVE